MLTESIHTLVQWTGDGAKASAREWAFKSQTGLATLGSCPGGGTTYVCKAHQGCDFKIRVKPNVRPFTNRASFVVLSASAQHVA